MGGRVRRIGLTALTFGLVGPPAGLTVYLALGLQAGAAVDPAGVLLGAVWLLPFAYLLGGGPAFLSGALTGALMAPARRITYLLLATAIGAVVAGSVAFFDAEAPRLDPGVRTFAAIGAAGGLAAGLASAALRRSARVEDAPA